MLIAALVAVIGVTDRVQAWAVPMGSQSTILPMQVEGPTVKEAAVQENLRFSLDTPDWVLGSEYEEAGHFLNIEFVRTGQTIENWQELLTIQNFAWPPQSNTTGAVFDEFKQLMEEECPGQVTWSVIQQDETSILYESHSMPCLDWPEQYEIGRFLMGEYNLFRISYTAKVETLLPEVRDFWIENFSEAEIYTQ
jgi:hypothetical protein